MDPSQLAAVPAFGAGSPHGTPAASCPRQRVPPRALVLSVAALCVPVYGSALAPESAGQYEVFLWLLALVPAFLLSYYRGWRGAALALAVGMGLLATVQVGVLVRGRPIEDWGLLLVVVATYISVSLGIGWFSELLHRERHRAERLALTDDLTGLANRRHAQAVLEREVAVAREGRPLSVVLFDLDHFKAYNDAFGHAAGDDALREFGRLLRRSTPHRGLSARHGGEEFLSVLPGVGVESAAAFVERVRGALRAAALPHGGVTVSAGVAEHSPETRDARQLLAGADRALYRAKQCGRDRLAVHSPAGAAPGG